MNWFNYFVVAAIGLLGLLAGGAKLTLAEPEVAFFASLGFSEAIVVTFGALQILASIGLIFGSIRFYAALVAALVFLASAIMITASENLPLASISMIPVALASYVAYVTKRRQ